MSARLNVCSVDVLDNPCKITDAFRIEITFEVYEHLPEDVEWELVFVASDGREDHDQILEQVLIGPIKEGRHKFVFEADAPKVETLKEEDLVDTYALLLKVRYREKMFLKMGWLVANEYTDPELIENPPEKPDVEKLQRKVCIDDVRVTTYAIKWDEDEPHPEEENNGHAGQAAVASPGKENVTSPGKENVETAAVDTKPESKDIEGAADAQTNQDVEMTVA